MSPLEPQRYSERLGVIGPEQLEEVAREFDLGEVLEAYAPTGGLFGQNLFLVTTEGEFVLRGNPHGHVQLTKERRVAEVIDERSSLPAPWPYEVCDDPTLFGWTYAVMPRLEGESGTDLLTMTNEAGRVELARATGVALARLHEATSDFFGPYDAQMDDFIEMDEFPDWFLHRLDFARRDCRSVNALSTEAELMIEGLIDENHEALGEPFTPVLVHHDFKIQNLNFEPDDGGFEATGVFDLFEAYLADGEEDIVRSLWLLKTDEERTAFLSAYTDVDPLRAGARERLTLYALADWLVIWSYRTRHGLTDDAGFVESVTPILENARSAAR